LVFLNSLMPGILSASTRVPHMPTISISRLQERLSTVRSIMADAGIDTLLVFGNPARIGGGGTLPYLTGWSPGSAYSTLVVPAKGDVIVVSSGPNVTRVFNQRLAGLGNAVAYSGEDDFAAKTVGALRSMGAMKLGIAGENGMSYRLQSAVSAAFPRRVPLDQPLNQLRLTRDIEEVAIQRHGAGIASEMIRTAMDTARRPDATPADIMTEVEVCGRRLGAENSGLWLATGERPPATYFELFELNRSLGPKDRVQLGATLQVEGYYAQCLRTGVRGTPSQELLDCTARLIDMQDKALASLVPGRQLSDLSDVLEAEIDAFCPYERQADPFRFQSCHAIGISYAEPSCAAVLNAARDRSRDAEGPLVTEGMIIEIHPNFTLPSLGHVCIGDMALVTPTGAEWITHFPRELVRLD
jgi:Xaa-Pro dipeptidase